MSDWVSVCTKKQLFPERGVAVLVGEHQVALFLVRNGDEEFVYAVGHKDPFSGANVMARGIVGSVGDRDTVASPMYKHVFELATGVCVSDPAVRLPVFRTWIAAGVVYVHRFPVPVSAQAPRDQATAPDPVAVEAAVGVAG